MPIQAIKELILRVMSKVASHLVRMRGVRLGEHPWILGLPDIKLAAGSTISAGNSVSLFSAKWANPLRPPRRLSLVTLQASASINIGHGVGISSSVIVCATKIDIGDGTFIGAECIIADTDFHGLPLHVENEARTAPISIGRAVFIGTRSIILKGVKIGDRAVIGAGSVVTKDIPAGCVAAGNPARVVSASTANQPIESTPKSA
jgi:acetyltransferase-like isoleucine patch superfamily enzyme